MTTNLRLLRNLLEKRSARRKEKKFVIEGPHLVSEALKLDIIDFVVYSENLPILAKLQQKGVDCCKISRRQFTEISGVETPQGILAVVKQLDYKLEDIVTKSNPLVVFCVEVQDPGNLGTIIRTADAVGVSGVILSRGTVDLYNQKVIRSTMGSLFHLPIVAVDDAIETINYLKKRKVNVVAADLSSEKDFFAIEYKKPSLILVGNEGAGLPEEIIRACDEVVKIPMPGKAESLNVAVSTAVILYEVLRQRTES